MLTPSSLRYLSVVNILVLLIPIYWYVLRKDKKVLNDIWIFGGISIWGILPTELVVQYWYNVIPLFLFFLVLNQQRFPFKLEYNDNVKYLAYLFLLVFLGSTTALFINYLSALAFEYYEFLLYGVSLTCFLIAGFNIYYRQFISLSIFLIIFGVCWINFLGAYCMYAILGFLIHLSIFEKRKLEEELYELKQFIKSNVFSLEAIVRTQLVLKKVLGMLKSDSKDTEKAQELITETIGKAEKYIYYLNDQKPVFEVWNLKFIVDNAILFMKKAQVLVNTVHCSVTCHGEIAPVKADSFQISQLLYSLLLNAAESMGHKGIIDIEIKNIKNNGHDYIEIAIKDYGTGIPEEELTEIFEPHYTTKGRHINGLGLSGCKQIIEKHEGLIKVESILGQGSIFYIYLKAVQDDKDNS